MAHRDARSPHIQKDWDFQREWGRDSHGFFLNVGLVAQPAAGRKVLAMFLCLVQGSDQGDFLSMLCY
jgi:hypothetical protein